MRIVIMGGGKVGFQLASVLLERKYDVRLIEKDKQKCMRLANDLDAEILCGDGTELDILEHAGTGDADCFIAVTGSDQDNLVACQLAKREFRARKIIARANNPRNLDVLRTLGADIAVSSTDIISRLIEQEVDVAEMHLLATLNKGRAGISAIVLPDDTPLDGMSLKDLKLPEGSLVISVVRGEAMMIPNGDTVVRAGDEIVAVCGGADQKKLLGILGSKK